MDISTLYAAAIDLFTLISQKVQEESKLASDAVRESSILRDFNENIRLFLKKAYSKEVIDEQLTQFIKILRELLFDSEDAIEDLLRPSFLGQHYNKRTFTVESREIMLRWQYHVDNLGKFNPVFEFFGLTSNRARPCSAGRGSSSKALDEKTETLVGIEEPVKELVRFLTENPQKSKMIFLHGEQGVGKTSLVAAVLRHPSVTGQFKYCAWIEDLRSCELANDIEAELIKANTTIWKLTGEEVNNHPVEPTKARGSPVKLQTAGLKEAFRFIEENFMPMTNEWALVLDDAVRPDVFKFLEDDLSKTHPSVLVTTRVKSLQSSVHVNNQYVTKDFEHVVLSEDDSRFLFFREMKDTYENLPSTCEKSPIKDAFDRILRRCRGLPLVILATSKLLKNKKKENINGYSEVSQLEESSGQLEKDLLSKCQEVSPNGKMVTLRMDHLCDVYDYLFYLSIFPIDRRIRCSTMMRLWMAESSAEQGLFQENPKHTLQKLLQHNVIQGKETGYGRVRTARVPNLLHQIIISRSKDEGFAMIVVDGEERLPENVRHLSFHSPIKKVHGTSVKRLRSLHVFKEVYGNYLEKLLEEVKRLKVLHIQRHLNKEDPPVLLRKFPHNILKSKFLRYLSLRGTNVDKIPEGIKYLAHLKSLDLKDTLVDELPEGILQLKALHHLLVSKRRCTADTNLKPGVRSNRKATNTDLELGVKAPSKLGDLTSLQKLCMIELKGDKGKRDLLLEELGKLTDLQRLGVSKLESTDAHLLCASIEKLPSLVALRLIAAPGQNIDLSNIKKEGNSLERVHLTGGLGVLPEWILRHGRLVKLVLKGSQLTVDSLQQLGELKSLRHLELEEAFDVIDMKLKAKFQDLCFLGVSKFDRLESIEVHKGALCNLETLSLARCNSLTTVPPFITHHTKLKCLKLWDMPKEFDILAKPIIEELRKRMKVKSKKWNDPTEEGVESLPVRGPRFRRPFRSRKK